MLVGSFMASSFVAHGAPNLSILPAYQPVTQAFNIILLKLSSLEPPESLSEQAKASFYET